MLETTTEMKPPALFFKKTMAISIFFKVLGLETIRKSCLQKKKLNQLSV